MTAQHKTNWPFFFFISTFAILLVGSCVLVGSLMLRAYLDTRPGVAVLEGPPVVRRYEWVGPNSGDMMALDVTVTQQELAEARAYRERDGGNYEKMFAEAIEQFQPSWLQVIGELAQQSGLPDWQVALDFIQRSFAWSAEAGAAYLPNESLARGSGDCDTAAIALAGLLTALGHPSILWLVAEDSHMGIASALPLSIDDPNSYVVIEQQRYYFIEPTGPAPPGRVAAFPHWYSGGVPILPDGHDSY